MARQKDPIVALRDRLFSESRRVRDGWGYPLPEYYSMVEESLQSLNMDVRSLIPRYAREQLSDVANVPEFVALGLTNMDLITHCWRNVKIKRKRNWKKIESICNLLSSTSVANLPAAELHSSCVYVNVSKYTASFRDCENCHFYFGKFLDLVSGCRPVAFRGCGLLPADMQYEMRTTIVEPYGHDEKACLFSDEIVKDISIEYLRAQVVSYTYGRVYAAFLCSMTSNIASKCWTDGIDAPARPILLRAKDA